MRLKISQPFGITESSCIETCLGIVPVPLYYWIFQYFNWSFQNTKNYNTDISGKIVKYGLLIPVYAMPNDVPMQVLGKTLYLVAQTQPESKLDMVRAKASLSTSSARQIRRP